MTVTTKYETYNSEQIIVDTTQLDVVKKLIDEVVEPAA